LKLKVLLGGVMGEPGVGSGVSTLPRGCWRSAGNSTEVGNPVLELEKGGTGPVRPPNMGGWTGGQEARGGEAGGRGDPGAGEAWGGRTGGDCPKK